MEYGVNVIGMPFGEYGLGQELRDKVAGLQSANVPLCIIEMNYSSITNSQEDQEYAHLVEPEPIYPINMICLNLTMVNLAIRDRPEVFEGRYNIVLPFWEFEKLPAHHAAAFAHVDEIWTPNSFLESVFGRYARTKPVVRMPLHVRAPKSDHMADMHDKYHVADGDYVFLTIFDCNSLIPRKDPEAAILAFNEAFGADPRKKVKLIIKYKLQDTPSLRRDDVRAFENLAAKDNRIILVNETMTRNEILALIAMCDAYVSPHRAEGLGRGIVEAMLMEKPVIATKWSGISDLLTPKNSIPLDYVKIPVAGDAMGDIAADFEWALPDQDQLRDAMIRLAENPDYSRELGQSAKQSLDAVNGPELFGGAADTRLREIFSALNEKSDDPVFWKRARTGRDPFTYDSGERQTGSQLEDIRADHVFRYAWALSNLRSAFGEECGGLVGADIFCGNGYGSKMLSELGSVDAIDGSLDAIDAGKEHYSGEGINYRHAVFPFELQREHYDFVVALESIEHVADHESFISVLIGALKPSGHMVVSVPNQDKLAFDPQDHIFHHKHFLHNEVLELFERRDTRCKAFGGQNVYTIKASGKPGPVLNGAEHGVRNGELGQFNLYMFTKSATDEFVAINSQSNFLRVAPLLKSRLRSYLKRLLKQ